MVDIAIYKRCVDGGPRNLPAYVGYWTDTRVIPKKGVRTELLPLRFEGESEEVVRAKAEAQILADREREERRAVSKIAQAERSAEARSRKAEASSDA